MEEAIKIIEEELMKLESSIEEMERFDVRFGLNNHSLLQRMIYGKCYQITREGALMTVAEEALLLKLKERFQRCLARKQEVIQYNGNSNAQ